MSQDNGFPLAVLITGASTGIGAACAVELANLGFKVFAAVRSEEAAQKLLAGPGINSRDNLIPVTIDVTDADSIDAAVAAVQKVLGDRGLFGLVNNAGIAVPGPLELVSIDALRRQFEVNAIGPVAVTRAFLPMLRQARGRIVNIGSVSGGLSSPYLGAYCASKFALEAITDTLRQELRKWGIHVAAVEPGPINTPIWAKSETIAASVSDDAPSDTVALYLPEIEIFRRATAKSAKTASPVDRVVKAVVHALVSPKPKTHYYLGWGVRVCFKGMKMLSDRARDWIVRKSLGLP